MIQEPAILDVTLRDGSYLIDFQFTASDTALVCKALESAGLRMIEVGHGIGLGASRSERVRAAETDESYMKAAMETLKTARWGVFCIPGIANLDDVERAGDFGVDFIRIGTEVNEVEKSERFVALAKKKGMFVCANFMKSYAVSAEDFAKKALIAEAQGADLLYIVDSAGGMMPDEMERYFLAVKSVTKMALGFHGHNNLGLAVANSLRAVELGAVVVDTSMRGMGRSSGNTPTETFAMVLKRRGISLGIDELALMDASEQYIKPLMNHDPCNSIDVISGYAQFHSSYMGIIREYAAKHRVDPRHLIIALCAVDKMNAPRDLVDRIAKQISSESREVFMARFRFDQYYGNEQSNEP